MELNESYKISKFKFYYKNSYNILMVQIIFYGLKRSGNHAIIHWILRNLDKDIIETMPSYIHENREKTLVYFNDILKSSGAIAPIIEKYKNYKHIIASVEEEYIDPKNTIINKIWNQKEPITKIFIIRDPSNCYASRIKTFNLRNINNFSKLFTNIINNSKNFGNITIFYDKWWNNTEYRNNIAKQIHIPNKNDILIVSKEGGISAFKDKNYNNRKNSVNFTPEEKSILSNILFRDIMKYTFS